MPRDNQSLSRLRAGEERKEAMSLTPAERAVVEAAKILKEWWSISHVVPGYLGHAARPLYDALEALDHALAAGQMVRCAGCDKGQGEPEECCASKPHIGGEHRDAV